MIEVKGLSKSFKSKIVLRDINLNLKTGSMTALVGPNASGKTTFIKCLLGLVIPTAGEIFINGKRPDRAGQYRAEIGFMPQTPLFPPHLTPKEFLTMLEKLRGHPAVSRRALEEYFHLPPFLNQPFHQLSGGTKQKVAAVMAFMFNPPLIILDKPTVGFDPATNVSFKDLVLKRAEEGATVLLVSHILGEVEQISRDLVFLEDGRALFSGPHERLLRQTGAASLERAVIQLLESEKGRSPS